MLRWRFACRRFSGECSKEQYLEGSDGSRVGQRRKMHFDEVATKISFDLTGSPGTRVALHDYPKLRQGSRLLYDYHYQHACVYTHTHTHTHTHTQTHTHTHTHTYTHTHTHTHTHTLTNMRKEGTITLFSMAPVSCWQFVKGNLAMSLH